MSTTETPAPLFNMKAVRKTDVEAEFKNFKFFKPTKLSDYDGQVIYINYAHPDKHIYQAWYVVGSEAKRMGYESDGNRHSPLFTLQELHPDAVILYCTAEDVKKTK